MNSKNSFDNFIRGTIFFITLTDFLLVCQLFEDNKKLTINNKVKFSLDTMTKQFGKILDKYVPEFAEEVKLELPKLNKVNKVEAPKIKLPKLKKV